MRIRWPVILALLGFATLAPASGGNALLEPQQAFPATARATGPQTIEVRFRIAKGYYLYREKLRFSALSGELQLGAVQLPKGRVKQDEFFGKVEIYEGNLLVRVPLPGPTAGRVGLRVEAQGCAEIIGVCFPPFEQVVWATFPSERRVLK
jgi:thiol:disulfide interchange protein DsbD